VLVVALLGQSYANRNISDEIRLGRISAFLLYPFGFISYHLGSFGAAQILNLITTVVLLCGLAFFGLFPIASGASFMAGILLTLLVSILWFFVWFLLSSSAFWLEESWVLRVIFVIVARFLSGAVIPLDLFPVALQRALEFTPFPYLTYVPVRVLAGTYSGSIPLAAAITLFWTLVVIAFALSVWRKGVRLYSAAGI
jgi:ABC-2 type transport system permease protein